MGGNAMAPFGGRRYSREEYLELRDVLFDTIQQTFPRWEFCEIPSYHKKDSFGDMDVLVMDPQPGDYEMLRRVLGVEHFILNSGVMSMLYNEFQIDIIAMPKEDYRTAVIYYAFNDLGNLMGKLYHKFGLKYGHRGLTMPMRDGDNQFHEVIVTKDPRLIFSFLELDFERFVKGFDTLEDIFEFVVSSKYFSTEPFQYENLNHTNRIRDKKRSTYRGFLKYIENLPKGYKFVEDKDSYLPLIFSHFEGTREKYEEGLKKLEHRLKVKAHFNGDLVSEWTGFKGQELGDFLQYLKLCTGDFSKWVLDYDQEQLKSIVLEWCYKRYQRMGQKPC